MMGKLLKYELRSMSRAFVPLWLLAPVAALMLSAVLRLTEAWDDSALSPLFSMGNDTVLIILSILFAAILIALTVMTLLFVVQRFWNGLLKDEGYLMFTLPLEVWQLVTVKGLAAALVACASILDGILSCTLLTLCSSDDVLQSVIWIGSMILAGLSRQDSAQLVIIMILLILMGLVCIVSSIFHAYASMAIGHLSGSHRVLCSCAAYVGLAIVSSTLASLVTGFLNDVLMGQVIPVSGLLPEIAALLIYLLLSMMELIVWYVITERILATRLNLE